MNTCDVAIVGAGPYGLSIAAHLRARNVNFRIFGNPMHTWLQHMPKGMRLKSEGFASSLYDPDSTFTLEAYCKEKGHPYSHLGRPVPLSVFAAYGLEFQKRFVPNLEDKLVESLKQTADGFEIRLEDGETVTARKVVMAIGLTHYKHIPPEFASLPSEFVSHSSQHSDPAEFKGREVVILGAGASALDWAALLHQAGAKVHVVARRAKIKFHDPPKDVEPSLLSRLRNPVTGIGPGWKLFWCANAPLVFRKMPLNFRLEKVKTVLGPAPCWFTKQEVVGNVSLIEGAKVTRVDVQNGKVNVGLVDSTGAAQSLTADHVLLATGYKVNMQSLRFLDSQLAQKLKTVENTPVLSSNFESSVPGMYFVGASAANTFGPLLRFAFGAGFAARRLSRHLASAVARKPVARPSGTAYESVRGGEQAGVR